MRQVAEAATNQLSGKTERPSYSATSRLSTKLSSFVACTVLFVLLILMSFSPLVRMAGSSVFQLPTGGVLTLWGSWLPVDLHFAGTASQQSQWTTHIIFWLGCFWLAFVAYLFAAYLLTRHQQADNERGIRWIIWTVTAGLGLLFVLAPAMLSHDIFVYVGYGRVLAIYHANPYFTVLSAFPHDTFLKLDDWRDVPSAYGPLWQGISAALALVIGDNPTRALLCYRLLALGTHLLNTLLVAKIVQSMGRSPRAVTIAMFLYAWNPLVLQEASLGGHNDVVMIAFVLLALLLDVRVATRQPNLRTSLPALIALTLAALIKFTAAPLLALYLVLLMRRADQAARQSWQHRIQAMVNIVIPAALISAALGLALYLPFWFGFTPQQIVATFTSPPSSQSSYGSFLYAIIVWMREHPLPPVGSWQYSLFSFFSLHRTWELINTGTLAVLLLVGSIWIWRHPSTMTLALSMQATLGAVLIVTFWFHAWYITWVVGLTAVIVSRQTITQVLFGLTFSASALAYYLFANYLSPIGGWNWLSCVLVFAPPLCALLSIIYTQRDRHAKQQEIAYSHSGKE